MSVISPSERTVDEGRRRPGALTALAVLLLLLAAGSLQGGVVMVADPVAPFDMSTAFLEGLPIDDYLLPGVFLIAIGIVSILAVTGLQTSWRWQWAEGIERRIGYRWPWVAAVAIGLLILAFEITELFFIPFHPVMHPLLIAVSAAILVLAWVCRGHFVARD